LNFPILEPKIAGLRVVLVEVAGNKNVFSEF